MRFSLATNFFVFTIIFFTLLTSAGCRRKSGSSSLPKVIRSGSSSSRVRGLSHSLAKGENLWELHKMYGVDIAAIKALNPRLGKASALQIGQNVFIPGKSEILLSSKHRYVRKNQIKNAGKSRPVVIRNPHVKTVKISKSPDVKKSTSVAEKRGSRNDSRLKKNVNAPVKNSVVKNKQYTTGSNKRAKFMMPMQNSRVATAFGAGQGVFANGIHVQSPTDDKVRAVSSGTVEYAGNVDKLGEVIIISHASNYFSLYADIKRPLVVLGENIQIGEPVAVAKQKALANKNIFSVYFELRNNDEPVDPLMLLK